MQRQRGEDERGVRVSCYHQQTGRLFRLPPAHMVQFLMYDEALISAWRTWQPQSKHSRMLIPKQNLFVIFLISICQHTSLTNEHS